MHYPMMTERQLAFRWKISLKTLRRWRLDGEGPIWHKLFQHVRYHEADVLEFERVGAKHWKAILGDGERVPRAVIHPPKAKGDPQPSGTAEPELQYVSAKEIVKATSLPAHLFTDRAERKRKRIPYLLLVRNLRFSLEAILQWELANSVRGGVPEPVVQIAVPEPQPDVPARVPRWHELVREQDAERFRSVA